MFLTQEKAIKKIQQERSKGEMQKAYRRALDALKRWPDDFDISATAVECCIEAGENAQAASVLKSMLRHHPSKKKMIIELARSAYFETSNPMIGSFLIELLIRSSDIEGVQELLRTSPESFVNELITRARTRRESLKDKGISKALTENNLLLALCYLESNQSRKAVDPLREALEDSSIDPAVVGNLLIEVEQENPYDANAKYCLGIVSLKLNHVDKAIARFFQSLDCDNPPISDMLKTVESIDATDPVSDLLKGEISILNGETEKGCSLIREYIEKIGISPNVSSPIDASESSQNKDLHFAASRVEKLLEHFPESKEISFIYADILERSGNIKDGVEVLKRLYETDPSNAPEISAWLERDDEALLSAPSKKLLAKIYLDSGDIEKASEAARMAAEMDRSAIIELTRWVEQRKEEKMDQEPLLDVLLAELASLAQEKERAEEILSRLMEERLVKEETLFTLARTIMRNCGISASGASSAIEACFSVGKPLDALPQLVALYRESPEEHEAIAQSLRSIATKNKNYWQYINELIDALSREEKLSFPMRFLQAQAHIEAGEIERAVFEFDQLSMINSDIRYQLVNIYGEACQSYPDNATLQLALYHLNLELELYSDAAHHLCKTLELDQQQIKDIIPMFEKLAAKEPENRLIWEEMLKTALRIKHTTLARDILKKALDKLPEEDSAALHIYGARIYSSTGNLEDSLKCLAVSLTSPKADLGGILKELEQLKSMSPMNPKVHYLLGETLIRLNRESESLQSYRQCISLSPAYRQPVKQKLEDFLPLSSRPYLISQVLGEIYWEDGDRDKALQLFMEAQKGPIEQIQSLSALLSSLTKESPDNEKLSILLARTLAIEGKYNESVSILEGIYENGNSENITALLAEILLKAPTQPMANRLYARILIDSGDNSTALKHIISTMSDTETEASELDSIAKEFVELYHQNPDFLIPYAELKARNEEHQESLRLLEKAFGIENEKWQEILATLNSCTYEDSLRGEAELLRIDCLIYGKRYDEAVEAITELDIDLFPDIEAIFDRIESLAEAAPSTKLYTFACSMLAERKSSEEVLSFARRGIERFEGEEVTSLKVDVAEILHNQGFHKEAAELLSEILSESDDRTKVFARIEKAYDSWADVKVKQALEDADKGLLDARGLRKAVETAIDTGRTEDALRLLNNSEIEPFERMYLRARIYRAEGKPFDALMVTSAIEKDKVQSEELLAEILYLEGRAAEEVFDFGRAYSAFSKILQIRNEYLDSRRRAAESYVKFIESSTGSSMVLVKCDKL